MLAAAEEATDLQVLDQAEPEVKPLLFETEPAKNLATLINQFEGADQSFRDANLPRWKKGECYWNNLQYIYWSEVNADYRTAEQFKDDDPESDINPAQYAKIVNIYRAHGESIIAAMSTGLPSVRFFPNDADEHSDVQTAKAYSKIAKLIEKQNDALLLFMHALFLLYNQGLVFAYNENREDAKFGIADIDEEVTKEVINRQHYCPSCGTAQETEQLEPQQAQPLTMPPSQSEMAPEQPPVDAMPPESVEPPLSMDGANPVGAQLIQCPVCGYAGPSESDDQPETIQEIVTRGVNKTREIIEIYGPLNVKIPGWVTKLESTPYLILETDEHVANLQETYPEIAERIFAETASTTEAQSRVPTNYGGDVPRDLQRLRRCWVRPWAYNYLAKLDDPKVKELKTKFPHGCYVVIIGNDIVAEMLPDKLDDHWTETRNPLASSLHADALGAPEIPIQDMTNEVFNLTLETIEFGIPEMYADPAVLDFDAYRRSEARPGQVSPAVAPNGMNLASGFHEVKTASLSREVDTFTNRLDKMSQFVVGSFPSIYGGSITGGSGTAREYEMSRAQALQRLSTTWTMLKFWWARVMSKAVPSFAANMVADERDVRSRGETFENVWIKQIELGGQVGHISPDVSEAFPSSWSQKRDTILNLIQMNNEDIMTVVRHPENAGLVAEIIGVPEMYIPGDDDRNKQLAEIAELIISQPMGMMMSSVPIEPQLDNHMIEGETCKAWMKTEVGQDAKKNNPAGYANVMFHMLAHQMEADKALMAQQATQSEEAEGGEEQPKEEQMTA